MNMLNTEFKALISFNDDEKELFYKAGKENAEYLTANARWKSDFVDTDWYNGGIYRLKLKEGEWYTFEANGSTLTMLFLKRDGGIFFRDNKQTKSFPIDTFVHIHPSTSKEIEAVKPQFKRGDIVVINCDDNTHMIARLRNTENFSKSSNGIETLSLTGTTGEFADWNNSSFGFWEDSTASKATPNQIKQLELEEMKHGKKWNGDGYDDCLTADGLTLNELLEHDLSEIEYKNGGVWKMPEDNVELARDWIIKNAFAFGQVAITIDKYRLKPKETFVDVEIEWPQGSVAFSEWGNGDITSSPVGHTMNGWCLSAFEYSNGKIDNFPIMWNENGTKIHDKAVNARFVKVGE